MSYRDRDGEEDADEAVIGPATAVATAERDVRASWSRSWSAHDGPVSNGRTATHRFFHIKGPGNHRASYPEVNASTLNPAAPSMDPASGQALALRRWTNWVCSVFWTPTVAPAVFSIFFIFLFFFPPLSLSLSLTSSTIRVRPPYTLHTFLFTTLFFFFLSLSPLSLPMSRATIIDRFTVSQVVILTAALKHTYYYYITRPCAYMFSLYIYIHVYILLLLLPSRIYIYEHIATRAHTHYCYMCIRIYTHTTHILYNRVIC